MSAVDLLQPILDGGLHRNNFFNGRLLSAEDLRAEQDATSVQAGLLARATGDGVAWGFDVSVMAIGPDRPRVRVGRGLALNRLGNLLHLAEDAEVALVPATRTPDDVAMGLFVECESPRPTASLSGMGAYVLVVAPTSGYSGTALVSDPNTTAVGRGACGARFTVSGVRFRLVPIELSELEGIDGPLRMQVVALLPSSNIPARERLRNLLAHLCFGTQTVGFADPLKKTAVKPVAPGWGVLDAMRRRGDLTDCDVPLAVVVLKTGGISFVDMWPARRKLVDAAAINAWRGVAGPRRIAEAEAGFLQFQAQLEVVKGQPSPSSIAASTYFDVLPAAGWLPTGSTAFNWRTFLGPHAPPAVTPVDAALLRGILQRSWFVEPFAFATNPPVPLRVYEVPEQLAGESFVVFARLENGNIRLILSPPPAVSETVEVTATAATGPVARATARTGGIVPIPDLVPGPHRVAVTAPDYVAIAPRDATVIGGRTIDVTIALTPLPNGSILIDPIDKATGDRLGERVESVIASSGGLTRSGTLQASSGKWLIDDLPAAMYTVRGTTRGFKPVTKDVGPTARGTEIATTLVFEREPTDKKEPPRCVGVSDVRRPPLRRVILCLVLRATEFEERYFYGEPPKSTRKRAAASDKFGMRKRAKAATSRKKQRYTSEHGELVYADLPWADMVELAPMSGEVERWLHRWREWFAAELEDPEIGESTPVVYLDPRFRPTRNPKELPDGPPGYAVFAHFGVPITIKPQEGMTKAPVKIQKQDLRGIREEVLQDLYDAEILYLDDLAWAWKELIIDATGERSEIAPYLIADAADAIPLINEERRYLDGVDKGVDKALKDLGILDDVGLANADVEKLGDKVGSRGFAVRLIEKARRIVSRESWSLDGLGLAPRQIEALEERGIDSKGAFATSAAKADGKAEIVEAIGLDTQPAATRDAAVAALANEAVTVMARSSIDLAPQLGLAMWSKVDSMTAAKLGEAGFASVEELAAADPAAVAAAANLAPEAATRLVSDAKASSRSGLGVGVVAPVSRAEENKLKELLGPDNATVGNLVTKTPDEIASAFGGNVARATAVLNGIRAGLAGRGIR